MTRDSAKQTGIRFIKQTLFSLLGTATDTLVLWLCSTYLLNGSYAGENVISPAISFECANIVNFFILNRFVFNDRTVGLPTRVLLKKFIAFNGSYTTVFFLKMGILLAIQAITRIDVVWCNLIALAISGIINFLMNDNVIFRKRRKDVLLAGRTVQDRDNLEELVEEN